jgi:uncharacterized protein
MNFEGFDWDEGNWPKCAEHGVSKLEIQELFDLKPIFLPDRTIGLSETRYNAVGITKDGRNLFVVFVFRKVEEVLLLRPISARYMHEKEVKRYEQTRRT